METTSLQTIISTMNQNPKSLLESMRINCNTIVINQCDKVNYFKELYNGHHIDWYDFAERGVGLSRNNGLMRATADIVQFADDDMVFTSTYANDILREYNTHPEADVILFSNKCLNLDRMPYQVDRFARVHRLEAVKFGGARITARREKLLYHNVTFSLLFGGGARYRAGEDVTFLQDCLKAGLKVYKSPVIISTMEQADSSWFSGYHADYFRDKGALLAANFPIACWPGVFLQALKQRKRTKMTYIEILKAYRDGVLEFHKHK